MPNKTIERAKEYTMLRLNQEPDKSIYVTKIYDGSAFDFKDLMEAVISLKESGLIKLTIKDHDTLISIN